MAGMPQGEGALLRILGAPLIGFVCNAAEADVEVRLNGTRSLDERQEEALSQLAALADQVSKISELQNAPVSLFLGGIATVPPGAPTSLANMLRLSVGGSIDVPIAEDNLGRLLLTIARDVFPVLLLPRDDEFPFFNMALSRPLYLHPLREELEQAILDDGDLKRLFPMESEHSGRHGSTFRSTGAGGGVQASMLHDLLIQDAWKRLEFRRGERTIPSLATEILVSLDRLRKAIRGEDVEVEVAVGFAGVLLPEGTVLNLPWGTLRSAEPSDFAFVPSGLPGKLSHTTEDGASLTIDYAGDVVLETTIPYRLIIAEDEDAWPPSEWRALERRIEAITLATLLAFERWPAVTMVATWRIVFDPLSHGPMTSWSDPRGGPSLTPYAVSAAGAEGLRDWIQRVEAGRRKSIEVGIRRLLSAATQRRDLLDSLVDAVIVWENLFGTRQGEVTMRVSASLAWLLEADEQSREDRYSLISKLYNTRSDVVHGNRVIEGEEAARASRAALETTLQAFRVLFERRVDLLDIGTGDLRSRRLIVGG